MCAARCFSWLLRGAQGLLVLNLQLLQARWAQLAAKGSLRLTVDVPPCTRWQYRWRAVAGACA
jgi:hypothetical protein